MATAAELEAKIKLITDWQELSHLWAAIQIGDTPDWDNGAALEYLIIRAFELDPDEPATVRYPYQVELFGRIVEQIDGAIHLPGLTCLVESKDWQQKVDIAPIVKMRNQLLRRPAGTIGLVFSRSEFTDPAIYLTHFTMPQAILLWSKNDLQFAFEQNRISQLLRLKYQACCERGIPDYDVSERNYP